MIHPVPRIITPPLGTPVDWANPVNRGLTDCYLFNSPGFAFNIVRGQQPAAIFDSGGKMGAAPFGYGLRTDGTSTGGATVTSLAMVAVPLTIEAYVYTRTTSAAKRCVWRYGDSGGNTSSVYQLSDNTWGVEFGASTISSGVAAVVGRPVHLVFTNDISSASNAENLYVDGVVRQNTTAVPVVAGSYTFYIGRDAFNQNFAGTIGYIKLYNRVLQGNEVAWLRRNPFGFLAAKPGASYFIQAAAPSGLSETPTVGSATFTGIASTILTSQSQAPSLGSLAFTGIIPTISIAQPKGTFGHTAYNAAFLSGRRYGSFSAKGVTLVDFPITPARGSLGLTGIASPLSQGFIIAPPIGSLTMTGFAPASAVGTMIAPLVGSAGFIGISSTLLIDNIIRGPPLAALAMTGTSPTVIQAAFISPLQGSLAAAGLAPTQIQSIFITPPRGNLTGSGFTLGAAGATAPSSASANFTGAASVLKFEIFIAPPAGSATATGLTPTLIQAAILAPPAGSGSFTGLLPGLLRGSVSLTPQGSLGASGFGSLIQLVTFVPAGSLAITGNNASVVSTGIQTQRTQLGPRFIPAKRYKLQGFANKFGTQQSLVPSGSMTLSGNAPTIIKSYISAVAPLALVGFAPTVSISTAGDRFITPPAGSLFAPGRAPNAIIGSTRKTQLSSRFIPGRRYGRFDSKAGININVFPSCGGGIRINYLVDGLGNYIVDESGNYILSYNDQAGTTAVFSGFLPKVQVSVLAGITISPSLGTLSGTSAAPAVRLDRFITPPKGDLSAAGNAPIASIATVITPPVGALAISSTAPNSGIAYVLTPPRGSLQATGLLSTIFIGSGVGFGFVIAPNNAVLGATGFQPLTKTAAITPQGQLSISGFAPTVSISTVIIPARAQIFALGQFPVPARSTVITPPAGSLSQSSGAPLQSIVTIVPAGQLGLIGYAPFVTTETGLRATSGSLTVTGFAPAQIATWSAPTGQASFTGFSPQIPKLFIPAAGQLGLTGFAPLFKLPEVILIQLKGAAVGTLTLQGKLIGSTQLSGNAIATVVISR